MGGKHLGRAEMGGGPKKNGTPKWMVKMMDLLKWMIWGETPLFLETPKWNQRLFLDTRPFLIHHVFKFIQLFLMDMLSYAVLPVRYFLKPPKKMGSIGHEIVRHRSHKESRLIDSRLFDAARHLAKSKKGSNAMIIAIVS